MRTTLTTAGVLALATGAVAKLNPELKRSFWGLAYSSQGVILPECGATIEDVRADMLQIAQLTPRIKAYGADCNQTALILQAIQDTNVDLTVIPAVYIPAPYNQTVVDRQWSAVKDAFETYGVDNIGGLSVGNEFLLNSYGDDGTPDDSKGVSARKQLLETAQAINSSLLDMGLDKHIPVGTSDAGSAISEPLCKGLDFFLGNDHPWFGDVPVDLAAGWTWEFFQQNDIAVCEGENIEMAIGETGWPTGPKNETSGDDIASVANLQKFLDSYICEANKNGSEYYFFQSHNADWTRDIYGELEASWGLFYSNHTLKDLTIPDCLVDSPTGGTVEQSVMNDADSDDVEVVAASLKSGSGGSGSGSGNDGNGNDSAALRSGVSAVGAMFAAAVLSYFAA